MAQNKLLIGVEHLVTRDKNFNIDEETINVLERIVERVNEQRTESVGLELPDDYKERLNLGYVIDFFGHLYQKMGDKEIIFLDSGELYDYHRAVNIALMIWKEDCKRKQVQECVDAMLDRINPYTAPEQVEQIMHKLEPYKFALRIADSVSSKFEAEQLWDDASLRRDRFMLKMIEKYKPEIAIIGVGHAVNLKELLNQDYCYEEIFCQ